jgi:hypothetical protein
MAIDRESGLPVVPHEVADPSVECDGCLIVKYRGDRADLICNECSALIRTVPADQVETALTEMLWSSGELASATCPHCGHVNTFPGFSSMLAFICSECGKGVTVERY